MFHTPGLVPISKNNLVWRNQLWGDKFIVAFYITIKTTLDPGDTINLFTIESESGMEKDIPGVYSGDPNSCPGHSY